MSMAVSDAHTESYESDATPPEISEEELVQHLSDQAHRIASAILSRPETGFSLTEDAQVRMTSMSYFYCHAGCVFIKLVSVCCVTPLTVYSGHCLELLFTLFTLCLLFVVW